MAKSEMPVKASPDRIKPPSHNLMVDKTVRTIRERAQAAFGGPEVYPSIEGELRSLVDEIASFVRPPEEPKQLGIDEDLADRIRRRFLGPRSAEEIAKQAVCSQGDAPEGTILNHDHGTWCVTRALRVVHALRQAGMLKEEP